MNTFIKLYTPESKKGHLKMLSDGQTYHNNNCLYCGANKELEFNSLLFNNSICEQCSVTLNNSSSWGARSK